VLGQVLGEKMQLAKVMAATVVLEMLVLVLRPHASLQPPRQTQPQSAYQPAALGPEQLWP
jgi:hypothetical protein